MAAAATGLTVRVGGTTVPAADETALANAIKRANDEARIPGLEDKLNPSLLDPAKATALVAAIARLPHPAIAELATHSLYLNAGDLPIRTTSPTSPASFAHVTGLVLDEVQGDTAITRVTVAPDCRLARTQAAHARAALDQIGKVVTAAEARRQAAGSGPDESAALHALSNARTRRYAIARAWLENAEAVSTCHPGDAAAMADKAAASQAADRFTVPGGSGMN